MTRTRSLLITACASATALVGGCSIPPTDKVGSDTIILRLATVDNQVNSSGAQYGPDTFVRVLTEVSGGRIRIDVETTYGGEDASAESELVEAIAEGRVDGGWPSTRAFADAGITGLAAIEAPLTITSYSAAKDLVEGHAPDLVEASLADTGVTSLGLAVGPLRRPFGVHGFLLSAHDWAGVRFRSYNSPVQTSTIEALGGTAVHAGTDWPSLVRAGGLDGLEFDVAQYLANGYGPQAGRVASNLVLWPKVYVLSLNRDLYDGLDDRQRGWIQTAADHAVRASVDGGYADDEIASRLCERGARFQAADPGEVLSLREAVQPVIDELARDPEEAPLLREVQAAAGRHPDPDTLTARDSCARQSSPPRALPLPAELAPIPEGTYRKQISEEDVVAAGLGNNDGTSGTWTLEVSEGHWFVSCRPARSPGADCGGSIDDRILDAGSFYGDEQSVWMVSEPAVLAAVTGCGLPADGSEGHCNAAPAPTQLAWSLSGDDLVFTGSVLSLGFEIILKPWVRID